MRNYLTIGMLAHVDAGKTTLSEALLYRGGVLREPGRVDHQDAFLDTDAMERGRGITIFSKQAVLPLGDTTLTLLDTPGHVDFSSEMERALQVLDYAILVISGTDGVQGHTATLWQLLSRYEIPVILFINKMDLATANPDHAALMAELKTRFGEGCVDFSAERGKPALDEEIALTDEAALADFVERGELDDEAAASLVWERKLFPCFFGAALKMEGVDALLEGLRRYTCAPAYPEKFGAKVFKITRDNQNNRLTHLKITGGSLTVRAALTNRRPDMPEDRVWAEKVNQIRVYSGEKFKAVDELPAGAVCAVTGLSRTFPGQGLGIEPASQPPALEPVLAYRVILPGGTDPHVALGQLRRLGEEDPQLAVTWEEQSREIRLNLMGAVQLEILAQQIRDRFGLDVRFDAGEILYRETIAAPVIGVGHFEPLGHYAEVHLLLEPGPRGSGLKFASVCPEDVLARSWQRLILTHLEEREHPGVLTGAPVADMKITLLTGRAHNKHTEGGDFREATYRAVRQGLRQAGSLLLEPWYSFRLELPGEMAGRAMTDLGQMTGRISLPESDGVTTVLTGSAPVSALRDYAGMVTGYTKGLGRLSLSVMGFAACPNQAAAVAASGYDPERDVANPADSVFCSHGAGYTVRWDEAASRMHLDCGYHLATGARTGAAPPVASPAKASASDKNGDPFALDKELAAIYERTYGSANRKDVLPRPRKPRPPEERPAAGKEKRSAMQGPEYLLVDGYNIIHAWEDLAAVARENLDAARQLLMEILSNYRGVREREIILVFDAYKVPGGVGSVNRYHNISVVYTKEAETADAYIEKVTYDIGKKYRVSVATSDGAIQYIILGHGALRVTPSALRAEIALVNEDVSAMIAANNTRRFGQKLRL